MRQWIIVNNGLAHDKKFCSDVFTSSPMEFLSNLNYAEHLLDGRRRCPDELTLITVLERSWDRDLVTLQIDKVDAELIVVWRSLIVEAIQKVIAPLLQFRS